jgi:hypothetical protein
LKPIALLFITFIGTAILMVQWSQRRGLEAQIRSSQSPEISLSDRSQRRHSSPAHQSSKRANLMAGLANYLAPPADRTRGVWPDNLVKLLSSATSEDLLDLISEIEKDLPGEPEEKLRYTSLLQSLRMFRDELDPVAVLKSENRPEAFMALARQSPVEALQWLESSSLSPAEREGFMGLFYKIRVHRDPINHLDQWKNIENSLNIDSVVLLEPAGIEGLLPVINHPENAEIRGSLITSVFYSSLLEGDGLARSRIEALGVGAEEIIASLESSEDLGSEETLEWAIDLGGETPERTYDHQDVFMGRFCVKDLDRAGQWLREFEGSPLVRDRLTNRYAMILGLVDPEAALPWIESIQDEEKRERTMRNTLYDWETEDPQSFAEWQAR